MSEAQTIKSTFIPKPPPDASFLEIESAAAASATFVSNQIDNVVKFPVYELLSEREKLETRL